VERRDIYESFRDLAANERFSGCGVALRREVIDGELSYATVVDGFDVDADDRSELQRFADGNGLRVLDESPGHVALTFASL
jgi:hypothetical protein